MRRSASSRGGLLLASALLLGTVVSACGADPPRVSANSTSASTEVPAVVTLKGLAFNPVVVTVPVGGSVEWRWEDGAIPHNVVADDFASATQSAGTFTHVFDTAGTFSYVCKLHPTMAGTVTVTG